MNSKKGLRSLGALSGAVSVLSALLLFAGLAALGAVGYEAFGPGSEPTIIVSAQGGANAVETPEGLATQADADAAYYEAMRNGPDPYGYTAAPEIPTMQTHAAGLIRHLQSQGLSLPTKLSLGAIVLTGFAFAFAVLLWVWRAHANLAASGIVSRYTPGRAVAAYLIPGLNLFLPFEAMRELYNRSHGEPEELVDSSVDNVTAWWATSVIGLMILSALIVKFGIDLATNLIIMTPLWMEFLLVAFAMVLLFGSTVLLANLTRAISTAQREFLPALAENPIDQPTHSRPRVRYASTNVDQVS